MSKNIHRASAELAGARKYIRDLTKLDVIVEMSIKADGSVNYTIMVWDEYHNGFEYYRPNARTVREAVEDIKQQIKQKKNL